MRRHVFEATVKLPTGMTASNISPDLRRGILKIRSEAASQKGIVDQADGGVEMSRRVMPPGDVWAPAFSPNFDRAELHL